MVDHDPHRGPWESAPGGLGLVVDEERGSLPYQLIHGESLVACAGWAVGQAGLTPVDTTLDWDVVVDTGQALVLHDSLCPMTPPQFLAECLAEALREQTVVVGTRPVTDTVKEIQDGLVGATVDRDSLLAVSSPLVIPPGVLARLDAWPGHDLARLVSSLAGAGHPVRTVLAPPEGRRVDSEDAVRLLEVLTAPAAGARPGPRPPGT